MKSFYSLTLSFLFSFLSNLQRYNRIIKIFLCAILFVFFNLNLFCAKNIILQRGNQSFAYETLSEAINNANNGDFLYLPPGNFDVTGIQIKKGIHIIGAGYHPQTTGATGQTNISGDLVIVKGAEWLSIVLSYLLREVKNDILQPFNKDKAESEVEAFIKNLPISFLNDLRECATDFFSGIGKKPLILANLQGEKKRSGIEILLPILQKTM